MIVRQLKTFLEKANDTDFITFDINGEAPIVTGVKIKYIRPDSSISDKKIKSGSRAVVMTAKFGVANAVKAITSKMAAKKTAEEKKPSKQEKKVVYKNASIALPPKPVCKTKKAKKD